MDHLILKPAYNRDYLNSDEVRRDWEAGLDFMIANAAGKYAKDNGRYCSIRDFPDGIPPEGSYVRYNKLADITMIGKWD